MIPPDIHRSRPDGAANFVRNTPAMHHILLPTDFSENAMHAARYAARLLGVEGTTFTLLHTYLDADPTVTSWAGMAEELYRAAMEGMKEWEERIRGMEEFRGAAIQAEVLYGPLPAMLADLGEERGADLVVMGTLGHTGAGILGSNAVAVVKQGRLPVVVVPGKARTGPVGRILFADDQRGLAQADMGMLLHLARRHRSEVLLAHVLRNKEEVPDPEVIAAFDTLLNGIPHRFIAEEGKDVAAVIDLLADKEGADMTAVLHRHSGFLEGLFRVSTAKRLALHTDLPLLVLREGGGKGEGRA